MNSHAQNVVPVYDEQDEQTNAVDFEAEGSTLSLAEVKASIGQAFSNGFGGVFQCEVLYHSCQRTVKTSQGGSDENQPL